MKRWFKNTYWVTLIQKRHLLTIRDFLIFRHWRILGQKMLHKTISNRLSIVLIEGRNCYFSETTWVAKLSQQLFNTTAFPGLQPEIWYHAHQFIIGTTCDLTNQPRETEVRFACLEPKAMISSITRLSTRKYALTVQCPLLCKNPLYQEERHVWNTINCILLPKNQKVKESAEEEKIEYVSGMTFFALLQMGRANEE